MTNPTDKEVMELMPQQMRDDLAAAARALAGFDRANVKAAGAMRIILNQRQTCPKLDTAMEDSTPLQSNPPEWIDSEDLAGLPDAFTDKRELWEMVATCTPRSCISAHYSSLTLRVVADFIEHRMEQAAANGWKYQPWRIVNDLRIAALTADLAIEDGDCLPRQLSGADAIRQDILDIAAELERNV